MTSSTVPPETLLEHQDFVRGLARSLLFDDHQVDDVVQQTWLTAIRSRPENARAVRSFLGKVVRSRASNLRRDEARLKRREREAATEHDPWVPSTEEVVSREATRDRVVRAVLRLHEPYRSTVLLRYFENRTAAEIAAHLGVPSATVRTRLKRGLEKLREDLDGAHGGERRAWCLNLVPLAAGRKLGRVTLTTGLHVCAWIAAISAIVTTGWWVLDDGDVPIVPPIPDPIAGSAPLAAAASTTVAATRTEKREILEDRDVSVEEWGAAALVGFRGRLLHPDGKPAADRRIRLFVYEPNRLFFEWSASQKAGIQIGRAEARSDAKGVFKIEGAWPSGHYMLRTDVVGGTRLHHVIAKTPGPGELTNLGDLVLEGVGSIEGLVVDSNGDPVGGALVWCTDIGSVPVEALLLHQLDPAGGLIMTKDGISTVHPFAPWTGDVADQICIPNVRTETDGKFRLEGVFPGVQTVAVQSDRHAVFTRPRVNVRAGKPRKLGKIRLREGEEIIGKVSDAAGRPVADAEVFVAPRGAISRTRLFGSMPEVGFARRARKTDGEGGFAVPGLPRSEVAIGVRRTALDPWVVFLPEDASAEHELRLPASAALKFRVRIGESVRPEFRLLQGHMRGEMALRGLVAPIDLKQRVHQEDDGSWSIRDLVPGAYTLIVTASGHALQLAHLDTAKPRSIEMRAAQSVTIRVVDESGDPLSGARVFLRSEKVEGWARSLIPSYSKVPHWSVLPEFRGRTDRSGRVAARGVANGPAFLTVIHPQYGSSATKLTLPVSKEPVVRLRASAMLTGQLMDGPKPADPNRWVIGLVRIEGLDPKGPGWMPRLVRPDPGGAFTVRGLAPGAYKIEVLPSLKDVRTAGSMQKYVEGDAFGVFGSRVSKRIYLEVGKNPHVVLNADPDSASSTEPGANVHGTMFMDGRPARGCYLLQQRRGTFGVRAAKRAVVDDRGRFELGRLAVGPYRVYAYTADGRVLWSESIRVRDGQDLPLAVTFDTGSIAGTVTGPDGAAVAGCSVSVKGPRSSAGTALTDEHGRFALSGLPVGGYEVFARELELGQRSTKTQVVASQQRSVRIQLHRFRTIRGRVGVAGFGFSEGGQVRVYLEGRHLVETSREVAADGSFAFPKVGPGHYQIHVSGLQSQGPNQNAIVWVETEVTQNGRTISDHDERGTGRITVGTEDLLDVLLIRRKPNRRR